MQSGAPWGGRQGRGNPVSERIGGPETAPRRRPALPAAAVRIRRADRTDAGRLARFLERTFVDSYGAGYEAADLAVFLAGTYGEAQQGAELADPRAPTFIAEVDGMLAGCVQLRYGETPPCVAAHGALELGRFYVEQAWQGRGLAPRLMSLALAEAVRLEARVLWLGVFADNVRAQRFYARSGFVPVGSHYFDVGRHRASDTIMLWVPPA